MRFEVKFATTIMFTEKTKLTTFILILFWVSFLFFIGYSWEKDDYSLTMLTIIVVLGLFLHFFTFRLTISNNYIEYSLAPFIHKKIDWKNVNSYELIKISALSDFGGWGIRYSIKYGWGYIMRGDDAIIFKYNNGNRITFSIKDRKKIELFLSENNLMNKPIINNDSSKN